MNYEIDFLPVGNGDKSGDAICLRWEENNKYKVMVIDGGTKESGEKIVEHIKTVNILKEILSSSIDIVERAESASLEKVTLLNTPTKSLWIFDNEDGEQVFVSNGKKVENTLIYLDSESKKLYIIMIELKSTLSRDKLIHCRDKFQDVLSHVSVYLLLNNHKKEYLDVEIIPVGVVCFNKESIVTNTRPLISDGILIGSYVNYKTSSSDNFLVELNTIALGRQMIKTVTIENDTANNYFSIDFVEDILGKL